MPSLDRRSFLQLGLGVTVLGAVGTACSPATPAAKKQDARTFTIYWNAGHGYQVYKEVIDQFGKDHDLQMNWQKFQWPDLTTKLTADFRSGNVPDLVEEVSAGTGTQYGLAGNVLALDEFAKADQAFGFPGDPAVTHLDRQYLLGGDLLVAPVFSEAGDTTFYTPAGTWTHLQTGETFQGPGWHRRTVGFGEVPVLVRPGTVLPLGAVADKPDYDYAKGVTLALYDLADGADVTVTIPDTLGAEAARFTASRTGDAITVTRVSGDPLPWRVRLGHGEAVDAEGDSHVITL